MDGAILEGVVQPLTLAGAVAQSLEPAADCGATAGLPHAEAGAEGGAATGTTDVGGITAAAGVVADTVECEWVLEEECRELERVGVPVMGIIGATATPGSGAGTTIAGLAGGAALASATAWPLVRRPDERCDALPAIERKPPLLATLQLNDKVRLSPAIEPVPDRSVKFIRMFRTESVKVQRWPEPNNNPALPERLAVRVQLSPRSFVTCTLTSVCEPCPICKRSRVVRSSVIAMGEVTETVVFDATEKPPAKGPGPRLCAAAPLASTSAESPKHACPHVGRLIFCMVSSRRRKIKRHSLTHRVAAHGVEVNARVRDRRHGYIHAA